MKTWNELITEAQKLLDVKFYAIGNEIKVKTYGNLWWYCDLTGNESNDKELFQALVNQELSESDMFLSLKY